MVASCRTDPVGAYVVEGHVRAGAIKRLPAEKLKATGLALPGMPVRSPRMEVEGTEPHIHDIVLFGPEGRRTFARCRGDEPTWGFEKAAR